jgi:hypothetical protein
MLQLSSDLADYFVNYLGEAKTGFITIYLVTQMGRECWAQMSEKLKSNVHKRELIKFISFTIVGNPDYRNT